ncbi:MAG TPA: glycosyltransferase family 4 protein [Candidatus Acidoferrales bacterium]|nr:glycosyltransferase family 4 protein [Candidatus Acidoferrales bacterium]
MMIERAPNQRPDRDIPPRTLFLGSFPPRECGIATFTKDVVDSFDRHFATKSEVVAIDEPGGEARAYPPEVIARLRERDRESYADIAALVDAHPAELLNIQHEYGLFGGDDGEWLLDALSLVNKPIVTSLHTVLPEPADHHRHVAQEICGLSSGVIVLSETGKELLVDRYDVDAEKVHVIHHGVPDVPFRETAGPKASFGVGQRTVISTFGLINRGKGLEFAIEAMRQIVRRYPEVLYLILGETHPTVRRNEGESYRESLHDLICRYGLENNVKLVDRYLEFDELVAYLAATDIYLTPYLNPTQIVSGTLAYAVGCGKAIVSTPYLYAQELLAHQRGLFCDFRDADSIAYNVVNLLDDPNLRRSIERRAYRFGRQMTWPQVAGEYGALFQKLAPRYRGTLAHSA